MKKSLFLILIILYTTLFDVLTFYLPHARAESIDLNLPAGWSMISLPVLPENKPLSELFPNSVAVYGYQKGIGYVLVKKNEELVPKKGYWILIDTSKTYKLEGEPIQSYTLEVEDGWYMIGGCSSSANAYINTGKIDVIYGYVQGVGYKRLLESENIEHGEGYWILLSNTDDQTKIKIDSRGCVVSINVSTTKGGVPLEVQLSALVMGGVPPYTYEWDLDGNETVDETRQSLSYIYQEYGIYTVTLTVRDSTGDITTDSLDIYALYAPTVLAFASPIQGVPPLDVEFSCTATDPDGQIGLYEWDFDGDGTYDWSDSNTASTTHRYDTKGLYQANIRVTDNDGLIGIDCQEINVGLSPTASASADPMTGAAPLEVAFTGTGVDTDGTVSLYEWDFDGDGIYDWSSQAAGDTSHTYTLSGIFSATLKVTDNDNLPDTDSVLISVSGPPIAKPRAYPTSGDVPLTVRFFTDGEDIDGSLIDFYWDFDGDGTNDWNSKISENCTHTYNIPGTYNATLKVIDNQGLSEIAPITITVTDPNPQGYPTASANTNTNGGAPFKAFLLGEGIDPDGTITKHEWDFDGDGVYDWEELVPISGNPISSNTYQSIDVGAYSSPAFVDIDNDGDMDMFVGESGGTIYFYRNDGDNASAIWNPVGQLIDSAGSTIDVGAYSSPAFVDIDNDGDIDMFAGESGGTIYFYRNDGDNASAIWNPVGQLTDSAGSTIDIGSRSSPAFADIDADGDMDMFVGESGGTIYFYRNDGDNTSAIWKLVGQLTDLAGSTIDVGTYSSPAFVDIDNDGDIDMFVGESGGMIYFYRNDGDNTLASWTSPGQLTTIDVGSRSSPAFVDIDTDGDMDMFVGKSGGMIHFYRNDGDSISAIWNSPGQLTDSAGSTIDVGSGNSPAFVDIDTDGDMDVFVGEGDGKIYFYRMDKETDPEGKPISCITYESIKMGTNSSPAFVDIDADGDMDIFVGESGGTIFFYRNDGDSTSDMWHSMGEVGEPEGITIDVGSYSSPAFADIDNDGDMDMFVGESGGTIYFYRNDGNNTSPIWTSMGQVIDSAVSTIDVGSRSSPAFVDIDNDGDMDMFVGETGGRIYFYRNDGDPTSSIWTSMGLVTNSSGSTIDVSYFSSPAFIDIDNDGDIDMFVGENNGRIHFYRNDGNTTLPIWTSMGLVTDSEESTIDMVSKSRPAFADIDNDGDMDMFVGESVGTIFFYRNDGDNTSAIWTSMEQITGSSKGTIDVGSRSSPAFVDIDADGDMDMFVGESGGTIYFYQNDGDNTSAIWTSMGQVIDSDGSIIDVGFNSSPAFADTDNDGDMDMFVGESYGTIYFYRNDGDNTSVIWTSMGQVIDSDGSTIDVGSNSSPAFVDIDNDGDMDIFVGESGGTIFFYRNEGDNTSAIWTSMGQVIDSIGSTIDVGSNSSPAFVDTDNDGDMDMFVGEYNGRISFYRNDGDNTSAIWNPAGQVIDSDGSTIDVGSRSSPTFVDIDNDGDMDIFVGESGGTIFFYRNEGDNTSAIWNPGGQVIDSDGSTIDVGSHSSPTFVDIDDDGDMDMFVGESGGTIFFYRNEGDNTSAIWTSMGQVIDSAGSTIDVGAYSSPAFLDIDNDGDMDMFVGEYDGRISFYRNDGDNTSASLTLTWMLADSAGSIINVGTFSSPAFVDIDNDGDMDMFVGEGGGRISLYPNIGDKTSAIWTPAGQLTDSTRSTIDVGSWSSPAFVDIDNDGDMDMFVGESYGKIYSYQRYGVIISTAWANIDTVMSNNLISDTIDISSNSAPAFVDIDDDGDMDMFVGEGGGTIYFYCNEGDKTSAIWISGGQLTDSTRSTIDVGSWSGPAFADIDNDGDMDMFVGESGGTIYFYRNAGDKTSAIWIPAEQLTDSEGSTIDVGSNSSPAFVDTDNDGDMDIFVGEGGGTIFSYRNDGDNTSAIWTSMGQLIDSEGSTIDVGSNSSPAFVDIDDDGDRDMFVGEYYGRIYFYRNDGDNTSASWTLISSNYNYLCVQNRSTPAFVDIDNDEDYDLFIGNNYGFIYFYTIIGSLIHVYNMPGIYQATFRVTDNNGLTDTDSVTIEIYPSGFPTTMALAFPITGDIPLDVSFIGKGIDQDGTIILYEWDFDEDGTFDWSDNTSGNTSYTYNKAGTYNATLRVTDNEGNKSSNSVTIETMPVISTSRTDIFNPGIGETCTITSNITGDAIITIKIVDESGNIISTLVNNEKRTTGDYNDVWDGKDDSSALVKDGLYYFLMDYIVDGKTYTYNLRETSQYKEKCPGVTHQKSFSPFENNFYEVTYHISKPSEVSMYIWTWGVGYADIEHVKTLFVRELRGTGDHTELWDGTNDKGTLVPTDKQYAIALIIWEVADNGIIITGDRPEISNLSASPNYFNPSYNPYRSDQTQYTVVSFNLSEQANIDCRILNNEGVLIKVITKNDLPSGANNIIWDGRDMTGELVKSGTYRISLTAIDKNGNRSMERSAMVLVYF